MKKMRRTKLTASLLAIMMLVMSMSSLVSATTITSTGKQVIITNIEANTGVSIKNKVFNLYRVFDVEVIQEEDDDGDSLEYTVNAYFEAFFNEVITPKASYSTNLSDATIQSAYDYAAYEYIDSFEDPQDVVTLLRAYVLSEEFKGSAITNTSDYQSKDVSGTMVQSVYSGAVEDGYYLIVDSEAGADDSGLVPAGALVTVPGRDTDGQLDEDVTVAMKGSIPTIEKEVFHDDEDEWDSVADYQIGDTVEYQITATVPEDVSGYGYTDGADGEQISEYTYIITDILSSGIDLNEDSFKITTSTGTEVSGYHEMTISYPADGTTMIVFEFDMLAISALEAFKTDSTFIIYYKGVVTEDAVIATDYESNEVTLEYSNNPYVDTTTIIGDKVYTYTFDLSILKTAGDGTTALADAKFALYSVGSDGTITQVYLENESETTNYYPATGSASDVSDTYAGIIITDKTGEFTISGLNDGFEYILKEIEAPAGYNVADPIYFKITAVYTDVNGVPTPSLSTSVTGGLSITTSGLDGKVINTSASLLPDTGGMGTTLFMIIGATMMFGAAVVLVVRRATKVTVIDL